MNLVMFAVNHFCLMNDILINIKKIFKFKTSFQKQDTDFAYTHADILKLSDVMALRIKMCIMIYSSTGIRRSVLTPLQLRNSKKIDNHNLYKFTIYEGEKEQYITYCTPETASLIDEYLDYRRRSGEKLTEDSFLIREEFDINGLEQIRKKARPVASKTVFHMYHRTTIQIFPKMLSL
jgi:hypothetical protein